MAWLMLVPRSLAHSEEGHMAYTWDRYRDWHRDESKARDADPLAHFILTVDVMFYAAAAAFAIAIVSLLVS